jgi:PadR family transcriptional regulator AphA
MRVKKELLLGEWAVLALLCEQPRHGYGLATLTARDGEVGRVWTVGQPLVYRTLDVLRERGLIEVAASKPGEGGPTRTEMTATAAGREMIDEWLYRPERRLRNLRSAFILKLVLLKRRGLPVFPLLDAQRLKIEDILGGLRAEARNYGDEVPIIVTWRISVGEAALEFTEKAIEEDRSAQGQISG